MIRDEGMERFYDLRGGSMLEPVGGKAFVERDWSWLDAKVAAAERAAGPGGVAVLEAGVDGVSCIGCLWLIEKLFQREPGALDCEVHPATGHLRLRWRAGGCDIGQFARRLQQFGYTVVPSARRPGQRSEVSELQLRLGLTAAFAMNCMAFTLPGYLDKEGLIPDFLSRIFGLVMALSATLALLVGGSYFIRRAWVALRHGILHMDFPIALGVMVAWVASMAGWLTGWGSLVYFDFVAVFLCLMLLGRMLQVAAVERSRNRVADGSGLPREVTDDEGRQLPLDELQPGTVIRVPAGGVVPVASLLEEAAADISLEWINGESEPETWSRGRRLPSGAVNLARRAIRVRADETWTGSLLERLAGEGDGARAARRPMLERILRGYVLVVVGMALLGGGGWLVAGAGAEKALQVAVSVLVVSCPCAIGLAMPLADELARSILRRAGVFLRRDDFWGRLAGVRTFVFDKTGTLTSGTFTLLEVRLTASATHDEAYLQEIAASLERNSNHPLAKAFLTLNAPYAALDVQEVAGKGLSALVDGRRVAAGNAALFEDLGIVVEPGAEDEAAILLAVDGRHEASFILRDTLRSEAKSVVKHLRDLGITHLAMISGDTEVHANRVAAELGLDEVHASLLPHEKQERMLAMSAERKNLVFVGDGMNDAPSLAASKVGIAMGSNASDAAMESADVVILADDLQEVANLLEISRHTAAIVRQNISFALLVKALALGLGAMGYASMWIAVLADTGVTIIAILNALRILLFRPSR